MELSCLTKECEMTFLDEEGHVTRHAKGYLHDEHKLWRIAYVKTEDMTTSELLEIKNNPLSFSEPEYVQTFDQEQCLEEINTQLCDHCLIPYDFQYCNECDLIYNPPPRMIYTIPEEKEPINSCASESESIFNSNSNSNNNDNENNGSSSALNSNKNYDNSNSNSNPKTFIALPDLSKEQELKWYSDNNEGIMPECAHNTDTGFDLRYPGKECTCIDLKIALKILATTIIQLASRSSLAKKEINIRERIIDVEYIENIIAMLQNDSEKTYIIEPNEKIVQAIFLLLVKIAQLVSVGKREELGITVRGIQRFGSMGRIDILVNMAEEEIVDKGEIISTCQTISIPPYDQYMLAIKREPKAPKTSKSPSIMQPERYVNITSQIIYKRSKYYLFQPEQLEQMNMGNLDPFQQMQLKMLLNNFNDIFTNKNEFGQTNII
ncbi:hypothetical protein G9A89_019210 [Geosiphon pyriformis]|nr:hypothetical protein G9A89_019210 [Geosiphon pyriformis]